jgi:hypothetical protein
MGLCCILGLRKMGVSTLFSFLSLCMYARYSTTIGQPAFRNGEGDTILLQYTLAGYEVYYAIYTAVSNKHKHFYTLPSPRKPPHRRFLLHQPTPPAIPPAKQKQTITTPNPSHHTSRSSAAYSPQLLRQVSRPYDTPPHKAPRNHNHAVPCVTHARVKTWLDYSFRSRSLPIFPLSSPWTGLEAVYCHYA